MEHFQYTLTRTIPINLDITFLPSQWCNKQQNKRLDQKIKTVGKRNLCQIPCIPLKLMILWDNDIQSYKQKGR